MKLKLWNVSSLFLWLAVGLARLRMSDAKRFSLTGRKDLTSTHSSPPTLTPNNRLEQNDSSTNLVPSRSNRLKRISTRQQLWIIPFVVSGSSVWSFQALARNFRRLVEWASRNHSWIPTSEQAVNLQTNVVTQVVNGPVITSVSILFATLASLTISNLYQRQTDIRQTYAMEVEALRELKLWIASASSKSRHISGEEILQKYIHQFGEEVAQTKRASLLASVWDGDIFLMKLLEWCQDLLIHHTARHDMIISQIQQALQTILEQRHLRWLALTTTFPMVHWMTLGFLALGIAVAYLVAVDQQDFLLFDALQIKILWGVLIGGFTSLGILCYDLSRPFGGAYQVRATFASFEQ